MLMRPYVQIAPPTNYKKNFTIDDRYADNWYKPAFPNITVSNWYVSWGYWNSDFDAFTWTQICRIQNDMESLQVWHTLEMWFKFSYWYQNWVNMSMLLYWYRWITVWTYWDAMNVKMQVRVSSPTNQTIYYADNIPFVENQLITIAIKTFDNWSWWCLTRYYMNWIELANDSTWIWPSQKVVQQPHVEMWWNMESQVSIDYVDYALPAPAWTFTTNQQLIDAWFLTSSSHIFSYETELSPISYTHLPQNYSSFELGLKLWIWVQRYASIWIDEYSWTGEYPPNRFYGYIYLMNDTVRWYSDSTKQNFEMWWFSDQPVELKIIFNWFQLKYYANDILIYQEWMQSMLMNEIRFYGYWKQFYPDINIEYVKYVVA